MKRVFFFIAGLSMSLLCRAQKDVELINKYVGDLKITNTLNSKGNVKFIKDLEGKIVIIDFWSSNCKSCFKTFPTMSALQKAFPNDLAIYYVTTETKEHVDSFFTRRPEFKKYGLQFITDAKELDSKFPHSSLPYYVWIGKDSRVKAITGDTEVTESHLKQLIATNKVSLPVLNSFRDFDDAAPLLLTEDVRSQAIESSLLTNRVRGLHPGMGFKKQGGNLRKVHYFNNPSTHIFANAYSPQIKIIPADVDRLVSLQVKDSSRFYDLNAKGGPVKRLYCFELSMRIDSSIRGNTPLLLRTQKVLDHYFGIKSEVRADSVNCYVLSPGDNLKPSIYKKPEVLLDLNFDLLRAQKPSTILAHLKANFQSNIPIVAEGFKGQLIDIKLGNYTKFEDLRKDLAKAGLQITEAKRVMQRLFITN